MNTTHVALPDMGKPHRSNFRNTVANAWLFGGVSHTYEKKWQVAEPSSAYKSATALLRKRARENREIIALKLRLARLQATVREGGSK